MGPLRPGPAEPGRRHEESYENKIFKPTCGNAISPNDDLNYDANFPRFASDQSNIR